MRKKLKLAAASSLLLSMGMGLIGGVSAEEQTAPDSTIKAESAAIPAQAVRVTGVARSSIAMHSDGMGFLFGNVHERNYLKLLVKAYTPQNEAEWTAAFEERKQVELQMPKPVAFIKKLSESGGEVEVNVQQELGEIRIQKAIPSGEAQGNFKHFDITMLEDGVAATERMTIPLEGSLPTDIIRVEPSAVQFPPQIKLHNDFTLAVESDDEAKMKELLPQLLVEYTNTTAELAKQAEQFKQMQEDIEQNNEQDKE